MGDESELSREELQGLLEIAGELAIQSDQDLLVQTILQRACGATGSPDGSVLLYDPVHQGLYFAAAFGAKGPELMQKWGEPSSQRVPMESNAGRAFTTRQSTLRALPALTRNTTKAWTSKLETGRNP